MVPGIHMIEVTVKARQDDFVREVERERLANLARATGAGHRRFRLRRRDEGGTTPITAPSHTLTREPAV